MSKKQADEHLQEVRSKEHNKLRYRKRVQQELEEEQYMKEELNRLQDANTIPKVR